jgi:hypothetical protein
MAGAMASNEPATPRTAEALLEELGISNHSDIDIDAVAQYCGATILYEPLSGCEARILGHKDRAYITVNASAPRPRQRFSAGHELGHWLRDRGRIAFACTDGEFLSGWDPGDPERRANRFAADLLLPTFLFRPAARVKPVTFDVVRALADTFTMSLTATAIRLVEEGGLPSMLICSDDTGRRLWFARSPIVPKELWPKQQPGSWTAARALLNGAAAGDPVDVDADEWIEHPDSAQYVVREHSLKIGTRVLSLLWWKDESQLTDLVEREDDDDRER